MDRTRDSCWAVYQSDWKCGLSNALSAMLDG